MSAGLLLVAALDLGFAPDGFAVGDLRRLQLDVDVVAFLEAAHDNLKMLLSVAAEQELLGLRIPEERQGRVLLQNLMDRIA